MTEKEVIERANRFLLGDRGITAEPVQIVCRRPAGKPVFWVVRYGTSILFPKETAAGATVDDGDYMLRVDEASGVVELLD